MEKIRFRKRLRPVCYWAVLLLPLAAEAKYFSKLASPLTPATADACGWIDYNNDGLLDAYLTFFDSPPILYSNNGDGSFRAVSSSAVPGGGNYSGLSWGDYDNNGFADLFVSNMGGNNVLMRNLGGGNFQTVDNIGITANPGTVSVNWIDYDSDGHLDLYLPACGNNFAPGGGGVLNLLFKNNGDGTFNRTSRNTLVAEKARSSCAAFGDYNNDGAMDAFLTEWGKDNWLFRNDGDGSFTKISGAEINTNQNVSITAAWGDYDNDGFLDLFVGNGSTGQNQKQNNYLFRSNGDGTFTRILQGPIAEYSGNTWCCAWGDVNNDGWLDLYAGTVYERRELLYINNGDGTFTETEEFEPRESATGTALGGGSFGDYDNDGFLDLLVGDATGLGQTVIFHNNRNANHWVSVKCEGTLSNRSAIGARVRVKAVIGGRPLWQIRDVIGVQGLRGLNDLRAHFGLGDATMIDSLVVLFPSGAYTVRTHVPSDQIVSIVETIPPFFLKSSFSAEPNRGKVSLTVRFTDESVADPAHPVTSWSWDFDNDGVVDSREQNPVFTFSSDTGAVHSVSLTISNGTASKTFVKRNMITVYPKVPSNLALLSRITASSSESDRCRPENAVDDDFDSKWVSRSEDPQWITVELDTVFEIGRVKLEWDATYGRKYEIRAAVDTTSWQTVFTETRGNGGTDLIEFTPVKARYVRMHGTVRAVRTALTGYSISEFEVGRSSVSGTGETERAPAGFDLSPNYPNPFNPETTIGYTLPVKSRVELKLFDIAGREVMRLVDETRDAGSHRVKLDGSGLSSGVYLCRLTVGSYTKTGRMVLIR